MKLWLSTVFKYTSWLIQRSREPIVKQTFAMPFQVAWVGVAVLGRRMSTFFILLSNFGSRCEIRACSIFAKPGVENASPARTIDCASSGRYLGSVSVIAEH